MKCLNYAEYINKLCRKPDAAAELKGSADYPNIKAVVRFFETEKGTLVAVEADGLPSSEDICKSPILGFHIHSGIKCSGNDTDPFADALGHYNPHNCEHPYHAGDMPPLFSNKGYAFMIFLTDRFKVDEIIGKTVIIHSMPDDFKTQPSGDSGMKIACGVIEKDTD